MIKKLLYMRHGQSEANAKHVYAGARPDIPLTELGKKQAELGGHDLIGHEVDVMVASPFVRAQQTAIIVADEIGYGAGNIVDDIRLHEIDVGRLGGQPDNGFLEYLELAGNGTNPDAETPDAVAVRVKAALRDIVSADSGEVVLIVAHAGVGRVMRALLMGVPLIELATTDIPNAEAFELPLDRLNEVIQ